MASSASIPSVSVVVGNCSSAVSSGRRSRESFHLHILHSNSSMPLFPLRKAHLRQSIYANPCSKVWTRLDKAVGSYSNDGAASESKSEVFAAKDEEAENVEEASPLFPMSEEAISEFLTQVASLVKCGTHQSGDLGSSSEALDGILGFGQANTSMLSQLASAGKVRKIFAHCLDTTNGGGIFAIGNVVQPKVNMTPMVPDTSHYNVLMKSIGVGGTSLKLSTDIFQTGDMRGTIIDSGTTLAYLPEEAFKPLMNAIFSYQPDLSFQTIQDFLCFQFSGSIDAAFPKITFFFENSVELQVYPHDYFFENGDGIWCTGFQNSALQSKEGKDIFLLGDLVLSNKLVVYDLENQVIGWTDYNCSSSIKIQDDKTGAIYTVDAHNLSSSDRSLDIGKLITVLMICLMFHLFH